MAIKKSELYSTLWKSCDELRGGMDASQYKDYVLVVLFVKYVSDKYKNDPDSVIEIPEGCTFDDFIALKGKSNIGEEINKKMSALAEANDLGGVINVADFCDEQKLGKGKDLVDTVSNLIGVFQSSGLDFGKNRANDTINDGNVKKRVRDLKGKSDAKAEIKVLEKYLSLKDDIADGKRVQKALKYELLEMLVKKYAALTEDETRRLVVENKWMALLAALLGSEMQQISQNLTTRVSELAERYAQTLSAIDADIVDLEEKVKSHLQNMGFVWN
jgi:hypothetical protein